MNEICKNAVDHPPILAKVKILIENSEENVLAVRKVLNGGVWPETNLKNNFYNGSSGHPCWIRDGITYSDPYIRITTPPAESSLLSSVDNHEKCYESLLFANIAPIVKGGSYAIYISEDGAIHYFDFNHGLLWYSFHKGGSFVYTSFNYGPKEVSYNAYLGMFVDSNGVAVKGSRHEKEEDIHLSSKAEKSCESCSGKVDIFSCPSESLDNRVATENSRAEKETEPEEIGTSSEKERFFKTWTALSSSQRDELWPALKEKWTNIEEAEPEEIGTSSEKEEDIHLSSKAEKSCESCSVKVDIFGCPNESLDNRVATENSRAEKETESGEIGTSSEKERFLKNWSR